MPDDIDHAQTAGTSRFDRADLEQRLSRVVRPGHAFPFRGQLYEVTTVDDDRVYARQIGAA